MELTLAIVAVVSLLMTLGMGVLTWRLLREERRRSAARITALVAELDRDDAVPPAGSSSASPGWPPEDALPGWLARVAGLAAAAGLVVAVVLVLVMGSGDAGRDGPGPAAAPIELLALEHEPAGAMLAITGSVRVAATAASAPLAVLATALDAGGDTVATGRIDLPPLAPGSVSPFAVELPAGGVSRYRISFLRDDAAVPDLDRRASARAGDAASETLDATGGAS